MGDYVFGANILENLTTGMYQDSRVIYREYIQNACDQIDVASRAGLLADKSEGRINIDIDLQTRTIAIEDNATGIARDRFIDTLGNIADSDKQIGEAKGFRGIGRLCGMAYCQKLMFSSKYKGEDSISIMECNAALMRELINQSGHGTKHTASEVLRCIYSFSTQPCTEIDEHWFRVELIGVNPENHDLLDFSKIKEYLAFVAPVPYQNKFLYRRKVYEHAFSISQTIDEYYIALNGEQVFKKYGTRFKTSKGDDDIFDVAFKDFFDAQGNLIAWMWVGLSHFRAVIDKDCPMRGIRLRKENIQIGNDNSIQKLFREDRGNHYFIGEVFAVSRELIPNSQRDYFNENQSRVTFEALLREFFRDELHRWYYEGSAISAAFGKIDAFRLKESEHQQKLQNGDYIDDGQRERAEQTVEKARQDAEKAIRELERKRTSPSCAVVKQIIQRIDDEREKVESKKPKAKAKQNTRKDDDPQKHGYRTDKLSQYSKKDRKLISKIFSIILSATDEKIAEAIISKIEDEL